MRVREGRGGGHTTQTFIEMLESDKDIIFVSRNPKIMIDKFRALFEEFILHVRKEEITLIDGRIIKFVNYNNKSEFSFTGLIKSDI